MFPLLLSLEELSPVVVPNASPNVFCGRGSDPRKRFRRHCLEGLWPGAPWWKPRPPYPATGAERLDPVFEEGDGAFEPFFQADARFPVEQGAGECDVWAPDFRVVDWPRVVFEAGRGAGEGDDFFCELKDGEFVWIADVDGQVVIGVHESPESFDEVVHVVDGGGGRKLGG